MGFSEIEKAGREIYNEFEVCKHRKERSEECFNIFNHIESALGEKKTTVYIAMK